MKYQISLGGGNPNADTFPFESMVIKLKGGEEIKIEKESLYQGLEYGPSVCEGERERERERERKGEEREGKGQRGIGEANN